MQTHLAREVREYHFVICELYAEECVGERLLDDTFYDFCISHIPYHKATTNRSVSFGVREHFEDRQRAVAEVMVRDISALARITKIESRVNRGHHSLGSSVRTLMSAASAGKTLDQKGSIRARAVWMELKPATMDLNAS